MAATGLDVLFGAPAGQLLGEAHDADQAQALARIALDNSTARLHHAQAAEKESEVADQQWLQNAMNDFVRASGEAGVQPDAQATGIGLSNALTDMAMAAYNSGRPALAAKYGKMASEIASNTRLANLRLSRQTETDLKVARDTLDRIGNIASSITDQASYDTQRMLVQANPQWGIDLSGLPDRYEEALPILQATASATVSMKDKLTLKGQEDERKRKERADSDRRQYQSRVVSAMERNATVREERLKLTKKWSGKPVGVYTDKGLLMASDYLKRYADEKGASISKDDKAIIEEAIASRAAGVMKSIQGITLDEATNRAIQEAESAKDLTVSAGELKIGLPDWLGGGLSIPTGADRLKFEGRGKRATPLPVPPSAEQLVAGKWYNLPQGPALWNGVDFDLIEPEGEEED